MGATDNAFIKAYQGNRRSSRRRKSTMGERKVISVAAGVSDLMANPASANTILQTDVAHGPVPGTSQHAFLRDSLNQMRAADEETNNVDRRLDAAELPVGPHADVSQFVRATAGAVQSHNPKVAALAENETAKQISEALTAVRNADDILNRSRMITLGRPSEVLEQWQPEWEVDHFRWPLTCEELNEVAADRLADIVRPVLNAAWKGNNVLAITSFDRGEGASTIAKCVAKMAASFNVSVALVEGDLEEPELAPTLGLSFDFGWNTMNEEQTLRDVSVGSTGDKMVAFPAHRPEQEGPMPPCGYLLDELSRNFELVVLDTGPVFTAAYRWFEPPVASNIDGTLIVRDVRDTPTDQIEDVRTRLNEAGIDQVAIVENFFDEEA